MKFVIQRVTQAQVKVENQVPEFIRSIGRGFLVLIGICGSDTKAVADKMVKKLIGLRIFKDENGKTNLDIKTVRGELLLISQFTLYADCRKGNRPSFVNAGAPDLAEELYEYIISLCQKELPVVEEGIFGADMHISLTNDGPFTILFDSADWDG